MLVALLSSALTTEFRPLPLGDNSAVGAPDAYGFADFADGRPNGAGGLMPRVPVADDWKKHWRIDGRSKADPEMESLRAEVTMMHNDRSANELLPSKGKIPRS